MSRVLDNIKFQIADISDTNRIIAFIAKHVNSNHIYVLDESFFVYEFKNDNKLNVVIAEDKVTRELYGLYAFFIYSSNEDGCDIAGGISQVSADCKIPLIGTILYEKVKELLSIRSIVSVGMNRNTSFEINRRRKDTYLGSLSQFYMLSGKGEYRIADIHEERIPQVMESMQLEMVLFDNIDQMYDFFEDEHYKERLPYKSREYISHRYFNHPIYKYYLYGVGKRLVLICREVEANGGKALRIVDALGDSSHIRHSGKALHVLMEKENYEYIDFMEFGMDDSDIFAAGFTKLDLDGPNIIPNYFEPFVQKNIEVLCCASLRPALIFKADADQDRPSIIRQ